MAADSPSEQADVSSGRKSLPSKRPVGKPRVRRARVHARIPARVQGWVELLSGEVFAVTTKNISRGGVAVHAADAPLFKRGRLRFSFELESAMAETWLMAKVVWRQGDEAGLVFTDLGPSEQAALDTVLEALDDNGTNDVAPPGPWRR